MTKDIKTLDSMVHCPGRRQVIHSKQARGIGCQWPTKTSSMISILYILSGHIPSSWLRIEVVTHTRLQCRPRLSRSLGNLLVAALRSSLSIKNRGVIFPYRQSFLKKILSRHRKLFWLVFYFLDCGAGVMRCDKLLE
jgi:hypothetical protein